MKNYLAWIGNLGVVPLFLFLAFLFVPAAFFLFALRILVTAVLETIFYLPRELKFYYSKFVISRDKLTKDFQCVKRLLSILLISLIFHEAFANEVYTIAINSQNHIKILNLKDFRIKNEDIITANFNPKNSILSIKAIRPGASEVKINLTNGDTKTFSIIAHYPNKRSDLKSSLNLSEVAIEIEDSTKFSYRGEIQSMANYNFLKNLENKNKKINLEQLTLSKDLRKQIWQDFHFILLNAQYDQVKCDFNGIVLECISQSQIEISEKLKKELMKKWFVQFIEIPKNSFYQNIEIKLKLIQIENSAGEDIQFGLDQLSTNLFDLFHKPFSEIIGINQVLLNKQKLNMNILAEPSFNSILGNENIYSVGSEIPFRIKADNGSSSVQFKFAGLMLKVKLDEINNRYVLNYETELSKPESISDEIAISGNKQKSSLLILPNTPQKLFEIEFKTNSNQSSLFPLLSSIPMLGRLFTSTSENETYKKIIGIIQVVENGK